MSTTIYDVTLKQLQEWLQRDDRHSGVFMPERLEGVSIAVGDYLVVENLGYFGIEHFYSPVLDSVIYQSLDSCVTYVEAAERHALRYMRSCGIEYEVWHVVDNAFDIEESEIELRDGCCTFEPDEFCVFDRDEFCVFGSIGNNEVVHACFEDVNQARIFAKRIVGYPCDTVEVDYYHSGSCSLIHCYHAMRGGWYDSGNNDAVTYLADALPSCDDSPIFDAPCNAWQEV